MNTITRRLLPITAALLALPWAAHSAVINVDINGVRYGVDPGGRTSPGPTHVGQSAAGGGTVWNGVLADSRVEVGQPDNDALFFGGTNLVDSSGAPAGAWFWMGPVAAGNQGTPDDSSQVTALLWDWVLVGYFAEYTGVADFTIGGLGAAPKADLYFYHRGDFPGGYTIGTAQPSAFAGAGPFTSANTICFKDVPIVDGQIVGQFSEAGTLLGLVSGFSIYFPDAGLYVRSTSPSGTGVRADAQIKVEVWQYLTQLNPASVQVFANDQPVTPVTVEQTADPDVWTITATPAGGFNEGATNTVKVVMADTSSPPVSKTVEFSFEVAVGAEGHRVINIDINGWRGGANAPVTFVGTSVAGGGAVFNGIAADSSAGDDNLTISGENLLDSIGDPTTVSFTLGPVAGVSLSATADPAVKANLFADFAAVGYQGQTTGTSDFTISGLGAVPTVDLYFYFREDPLSDGQFAGSTYTIEGTEAMPFAAHGIFNDGNTVYVKNVPVVAGQVVGVFSGQVGAGGEGSAAGAMSGLTIQKPLPKPYVRKALPKGDYVRPDAGLQIELQDYVTAVDTASISLLINGQPATPAISKPAGSTVTTVTYTPPKGWVAETVNTMKITFSNVATPPLEQSEEFSFFVISPLKASRIVNVDLNGVGHSTLPLGPTYVGSGAAGGGPVFNGIAARCRQEDGTDNDQITVEGANLLDSVGNATTFGFTISPVGAGNSGAVGGQFSEKWSAINHDWLIIGYVGGGYNCANQADFTISGLGTAPVANLYFYFREDPREGGRFGSGAYVLPGVTGRSSFAGRGLFSDFNTTYFEKVPVTDGKITGVWRSTSVLALMTGLTIELPLPHAYVKSYSPQGSGLMPDVQVQIELADFDVVQVDPASIELSINGSAVTPQINKPAGSTVTTVTYAPPGGWPQGSLNHVSIAFSDTAAPPVVQTKEFSFQIIDMAFAAKVINIDINGSRNGQGGVPEIGPTYVGQSPPGGGAVWNGIVADSRLPDGQDDDALYFSAENLLNSVGGTTSVGFSMGPVAGGNQGAGDNPAAQEALYYDWVLVGYFGETVGTADFTISGLGANKTADLYFYNRGDGWVGSYSFGGMPALPSAFTPVGIFTSPCVAYYKDVAVADGTITGQFTETVQPAASLGLLSGLTIVMSPVTQPPGPLSAARTATGITLTWPGAGTLQSAAEVTGPWSDVAGASSGFTLMPTDARKFFRLVLR